MAKRRIPRTGRKSFAVPSVKSMADSDPPAPAAKPGAGEPEKPADGSTERLIRMIKAAYQ